MARKKKRADSQASDAWLVTFSDLVTLLLTFFVLLLSMSSMDHEIISRISLAPPGMQQIGAAGGATPSTRIKVVKEILEDPETIMKNKDKLKDLLLPDVNLPPTINRKEALNDIEILQHPEGIVIALTDRLVFEDGSYTLTPVAREVLNTVSDVLNFSTADVNISGHTDNTTYPNVNSFELSGFRALSVLEHFLLKGHRPARFSVSGYGADRPLFPNDGSDNKIKNNRVEVLLKTTQWLGRYT
ncbi:OmpA/MotB family protein [Desulfovibrio litoralis]|uniref:Chemotaxis protein MotB n=1 Tax=Desulfovibrio litoralis DSM 11393 TaxID=1121455 RepID=A0A1M7TB43_9BACT|nr:OmpA family protein [Desulfovibrio litoralis]SHN67949.1 chemotaxis protein MotB [Desulfovibrio litoralis DSM 11393]